MAKKIEELSPSRRVATKTIFEALKILKENGGELSGKEVLNEIEKRVELDEWEKSRYEKTGYIRWQSILHFYTIDLAKAGFLRKKSGIWILTSEGEKAMKLGAVALLDLATQKYKIWKAEQEVKDVQDENEVEDDVEQLQKANLEQLEEQALESLRDYIKKLNPYDFQDMVAALLKAMGYYVPYIAERGPDGGVDIVAYQDPLGVKAPRIKVQVKHHPESTIALKDIHSLIGVLNKDGDIGLFVTSGKFSKPAEKAAKESHLHVRLLDFTELVSLWKQFYSKLTDEEKNYLPLHTVYFLGSKE